MLELLASSGPAVVALGGGAVETDDVRAALADHLVIHVDVDVDTAWARAARSKPSGRWRATAQPSRRCTSGAARSTSRSRGRS